MSFFLTRLTVCLNLPNRCLRGHYHPERLNTADWPNPSPGPRDVTGPSGLSCSYAYHCAQNHAARGDRLIGSLPFAIDAVNPGFYHPSNVNRSLVTPFGSTAAENSAGFDFISGPGNAIDLDFAAYNIGTDIQSFPDNETPHLTQPGIESSSRASSLSNIGPFDSDEPSRLWYSGHGTNRSRVSQASYRYVAFNPTASILFGG